MRRGVVVAEPAERQLRIIDDWWRRNGRRTATISVAAPSTAPAPITARSANRNGQSIRNHKATPSSVPTITKSPWAKFSTPVDVKITPRPSPTIA